MENLLEALTSFMFESEEDSWDPKKNEKYLKRIFLLYNEFRTENNFS